MSASLGWDVIVVGAGPGGSTASALLAGRGHRVLMLDKEEFPRFHIGESLLPASGFVEKHLGLVPDMNVFRYKRGAQFVCEKTNRLMAFDFAEALPGPPRHAWHVERAGFDKMLRDRAVAFGAEARHGVTVTDIDIDAAGVTVRTDAGAETARYVIDATGQDRFVAKRRRAVRPYKHFGKAASFTHYEGIRQSTWDEVGEGNDIRVMMVPDGWAWVIPLAGDRLSIGLVHKRPGIRADDVLDYVKSSPLLSRWTEGSKPRPTHIIGNFSYKNAEPFGERYACVGDAACFIDPVFSSGVSLAIASASSIVEQLSPALAEGREGDPHLMTPFAAYMERGYETFASLVYRFYNKAFVDNLIFGAPREGDLRASVVSVLGGDVFRPDNRFRDMLIQSRTNPWRDDQTAEPTEVPEFMLARSIA